MCIVFRHHNTCSDSFTTHILFLKFLRVHNFCDNPMLSIFHVLSFLLGFPFLLCNFPLGKKYGKKKSWILDLKTFTCFIV